MALCDEAVNAFLGCDWFYSCEAQGSRPTVDCEMTSDIEGLLQQEPLKLWDSIRLEARGDVTAYLAVNAPEAYNENWNRLALQVRNEILLKLEPGILKSLEQLGLPRSACRSVRTDLINILLVLSYRDYVTSKFHEDLFLVYKQGFLPCGWKGEYPRGTLLVFGKGQ